LSDDVSKNATKIKSTDLDIKKSSQNILRKEEYDDLSSKQRIEALRQIQELEKKVTNYEKKIDKQRKDDLDNVNKRLLEFENEIKPIGELKEEYRVNQRIEEVTKHLAEVNLANEETSKSQKLFEDNYRLEYKKISDLQVEVSTIRKKMNEERTTIESHMEFVRKLEARINDLINQEQLRKQEQLAFIENQSRSYVDRENLWKEWQARFDRIEELSSGLQTQLIELEKTHRTVKKSQADFEEINLRLDRRINEITEMNRLAEERFRQEWISFKADDQKRWTNYSLTQEEETREASREAVKIMERLTALEDESQNLIDSVNIINEETEKRIKALLSLSNDLLNSFEQTLGKRM
jgi:chromosome segregation ATPase